MGLKSIFNYNGGSVCSWVRRKPVWISMTLLLSEVGNVPLFVLFKKSGLFKNVLISVSNAENIASG